MIDFLYMYKNLNFIGVNMANQNMVIVSVLNPKGGATKTTVVMSLARAFQHIGLSVAIGETDPQGSLRKWRLNLDSELETPMPAVIDLPNRDSIFGVRDNPALEGVELLLIDGVAFDVMKFAHAHKVSNFVLLVTQPSPGDLGPLIDMFDLGTIQNGNAMCAFLLSRTKKNDDLNDVVRAALAQFNLPILNSTIRDLKGFKTSQVEGKTVFEYGAYIEAQRDVMAVASEVLELMQGGKK